MKIRIIMLVCVLGVGIYLAGCSVGDSRTTDDSSAAQVAENIELTEMNNSGYTYENYADEGSWVETTSVDQEFLDGIIYQTDQEINVFQIFESDGKLKEPYASVYADLAEYKGV